MLKQGTPRICKHTHSQSHQSLVEDDFWHLVDGFLWYGKQDWNEHLKYSDGFHSRPKVDLVRKHLTSHAQSDWVVSKRPYRCDDVSSEAPNHQHSSERKNPPNCECFDLQLAHSARKAVEQLEVMQKQGDRDDGNTLESFRWRIESQWGLCLFVWASKASENLFHFWNAPQKNSLDKMGPFCFLAHWKKKHPVFFSGRLKPGGFVFHGWPHPNCVDQQRLGKIASAMSALGIPGFHPWKVRQFSQGVEGNNERANLGGWEPGLFQVYILRPWRMGAWSLHWRPKFVLLQDFVFEDVHFKEEKHTNQDS